MTSRPEPEAGSSPMAKTELPGEFVSDDLRADCARFLEEQRALIRYRREFPRERASWLPNDNVGQSPPNSPQSGQ
jgi:hypothetical protein